MKTLKFEPHLVEQILSGEKTSTWRLFDDKNLKEGDEVIFLNKETGEEFGKAKINEVRIRTLSTLEDSDYEGHQKYSSDEEMVEDFKKYYGDKVNKDSEVKIIFFAILKS